MIIYPRNISIWRTSIDPNHPGSTWTSATKGSFPASAKLRKSEVGLSRFRWFPMEFLLHQSTTTKQCRMCIFPKAIDFTGIRSSIIQPLFNEKFKVWSLIGWSSILKLNTPLGLFHNHSHTPKESSLGPNNTHCQRLENVWLGWLPSPQIINV